MIALESLSSFLEKAQPFSILWSKSDGKLLWISKSLKRTWFGSEEAEVEDSVELYMKRPFKSALRPFYLPELTDTSVVLCLHDRCDYAFKGQVVEHEGCWCFLGSPSVGRIRELRDYGFELNEVPLHDRLGDLIIANESNDLAIKRSKESEAAVHLVEEKRRIAQAENEAKTAFLSSMSHEIRTPLNAILGYVQLLKHEQGLTAEQQGYINTIYKGGEHLVDLLNGVLDMAKIESGRKSVFSEEINLWQMFSDLERIYSLNVEEKNVRLSFKKNPGVPEYVFSDRGKLRQILLNLLSNAVKYTDEGSIKVELSSLPQGPQKCLIEFSFTDTGCGIEEEEIEDIFLPFKQANTRRGKIGSGLGLTVGREYANLLGGTIEATSVVGEGSVFVFQFEALIPEQVESEKTHKKRVSFLHPAETKPSVMILDDLADNCLFLQRMLESVGFVTVTFQSAKEALIALQKHPVDLLMTDLVMPEMDGLEVIEALKASESLRDIPVILTTASVLDSEEKRALEAGASGFLAKPINEEELFHLLQSVLHLEYIYEGDTDVQTMTSMPSLHSFESIENVPQDFFSRLKEAVFDGDIFSIEEMIEELESTAPKIARSLQQFSENYNYERMLTFLEDVEEDS